MKNFNFFALSVLLFLSGCSGKWNPFIPPSSVSCEDYDSLPPQEPIRSKGMYRATMKPYTVRGVTYYPIIPKIGQKFRGVASWYGPNFHGGKTSNGEYYDMTSLTAAHKTLPMNTLVRVTNLKTGASTIVRINDRGPFVEGRIIDLSYQAAQELGMLDSGVANVELEVIDVDDALLQHHPSHKVAQSATTNKESVRYGVSKELYDEYGNVIPDTPEGPTFKPKLSMEDLERAKYIQRQKRKPSTTHTKASDTAHGYKVQVLSTNNREKAKAFVKKYATIDDKYHALLKTKDFWGKKFYRVLIGNFKDTKSAKNFIQSKGLSGAFIVKD